MNKREKNRLAKQYKDYLIKKNVYEEVHETLVTQLVDWIDIDSYTKGELEQDPTNWVLVSTISVASKNIQNIMTKLGLTPQIQKLKVEVNKPIDLQDVIKEITSSR